MVITKQDLKKKLEELDRKIVVLEWDKMRDQINPSKLAYLENLKGQRDFVLKEIKTAPEAEEEKKTEKAAETLDKAEKILEEVKEEIAKEVKE